MLIAAEDIKPLEQDNTIPWVEHHSKGFYEVANPYKGQRVLYCSGLPAVRPETWPSQMGDMLAQINRTLDNLEEGIFRTGIRPADIVRLNIYTTDVSLCLRHFNVFSARLSEAGYRYSCSLFGVERLTSPNILVEIEATAVA